MKEYIDSKKEEIISSIKDLVSFRSISERTNIEGAPFGEECKKALDYILKLGEKLGFRTKNVDGYCGYIEFGEGEELVGIIGHLDVVPANIEDGWTSSPFEAEVRNNRLYGRGTIDDKGPVIAALYAMKAVAEKMKINKRVRLIVGLNEEKNWECINYYKRNEELPTIGFSPDADFPSIYAEKGIVTVRIEHDFSIPNAEILDFSCAGNAINVVPKYCSIRLKFENPDEKEKYKNEPGVHIEKISENTIKIIASGISAHGAHPDLGDNAITKLLIYLEKHCNFGENSYINILKQEGFFEIKSPKFLGGEQTSDFSGVLTSNIGVIKYENGKLILYTNLRVPVETGFDKIKNYFEELKIKIPGLEFGMEHAQNKLYIDKNSYLVKTLTNIFNEEAKMNEEPMAIGGGTYARAFNNCISFGLNFPNDKDMCHQVDEFVDIDKLILGTKIYARAIYELAK